MNEQNINASAFQLYDIVVTTYTRNQVQWIPSDCADITIINTSPLIGGATMVVNGFVMAPGIGISITANDGELDKTQYNLMFQAGIASCTVIRKLYKRA